MTYSFKPYRNRKVEQCVLHFLKSLSRNTIKLPFDIHSAINSLPYGKVHSYQAFSNKHNISIDEVIAYCQSDTGCTHKGSNNYIIMYNDSPSIVNERKRFTLAHELGHILLGHFSLVQDSSIAQNNDLNKKIEREADYFAACLLSPMPVAYYYKLKSASDLQKLFGISTESSLIAWKDLSGYDKCYYIPWHNDMVNIFL